MKQDMTKKKNDFHRAFQSYQSPTLNTLHHFPFGAFKFKRRPKNTKRVYIVSTKIISIFGDSARPSHIQNHNFWSILLPVSISMPLACDCLPCACIERCMHGMVCHGGRWAICMQLFGKNEIPLSINDEEPSASARAFTNCHWQRGTWH